MQQLAHGIARDVEPSSLDGTNLFADDDHGGGPS